MNATLYKVVTRSQWRVAESDGVFRGSEVDIADGFIHLSAADQTIETVAKHFAGQSDLMLIAVDAAALGDTVRWEPSRGGALFPHVYGDLPLTAVRGVQPLPIGDDGRHQFPDDFAGSQ
ncbi:MAG: DUF952 domain-containing protein [Pirellulaceae bacterium]|nr:DUF952 domain-containing protein [Pirellulaceae bacterium]